MIKLAFWSLISLLCIDISISNLVTTPQNNVPASSISRYFSYGRSIESKLFHLVDINDTKAANITKAGWFKPLENNRDINLKKKKRVIVYGMSFSNHIGSIIAELAPSFDVRMFAGPGAPLNHSYAYYQQHRPHKKGDIILLGILASSIPRINTLTHMTASFEAPAAHFYPRYSLDQKNRIQKKQVQINSLAKLRQTMNDKNRWNNIKNTLAQEDAYYTATLFSKNFTDESTYAKLIKRAWGQKHKVTVTENYHDSHGFKNTDRLVDLSQTLLSNFAQQVRDDGAIPFVLLFNDLGFNDHLYLMLQSTLEKNNILFYSTHFSFPTAELSNFIPDGHFTPEIDQSIAKSVLKELKQIHAGSIVKASL